MIFSNKPFYSFDYGLPFPSLQLWIHSYQLFCKSISVKAFPVIFFSQNEKNVFFGVYLLLRSTFSSRAKPLLSFTRKGFGQ